mmetsp:Transcript_67001/g.170037  ORF Transcript_67001/g.170037 Transcript_67001/m.170037 type:complete len:258 (-) Transcript_67001:340-1113(-)
MILQFHLVARIDSLLPLQLFQQVRSLAHEGGPLGLPRGVDLQVRHLLIHRRRLNSRADGHGRLRVHDGQRRAATGNQLQQLTHRGRPGSRADAKNLVDGSDARILPVVFIHTSVCVLLDDVHCLLGGSSGLHLFSIPDLFTRLVRQHRYLLVRKRDPGAVGTLPDRHQHPLQRIAHDDVELTPGDRHLDPCELEVHFVLVGELLLRASANQPQLLQIDRGQRPQASHLVLEGDLHSLQCPLDHIVVEVVAAQSSITH